MSITVKALDAYKAKKVLKTCPKIVRDYVKALQSAVEGSQRTTQIAIAKIKEQSKELDDMIKYYKGK